MQMVYMIWVKKLEFIDLKMLDVLQRGQGVMDILTLTMF